MSKKVLIIINIALLVAATVAVCLILGVGQKSDAALWQEQYDLGVRYLTEGNYEEAVIAFAAAIRIDPNRSEAYAGAARSYMAMGEGQEAIRLLREGWAITGEESLAELLENYEARENPESQTQPVTQPETEPETVPETEPAERETMDDAEVTEALEELLVGVGAWYYYGNQEADTSDWTDATIAGAIHSKLLHDSYRYSSDSYLSNIGLQYRTGEDWYLRFDLDLIQRITRDTFDRDFPVNIQESYIFVSGDELCIMEATGESTSMGIQDFVRQGDTIIAVGTRVHHYNANSEFIGYFQATFRENPASLYGFTLVSLKKIEGNQAFGNLTATASSVLPEAASTYNAANVLDGRPETAWVEGARGTGTNEWIRLETRDGSRMYVTALDFFLGYHKNDDILRKNGWPTKVLIEWEGGHQQTVEFYNYDDCILLDSAAETSWIKITILEAKAGSKYDDTCISEIRLRGIDVQQFFE